jgi:hypothetical protein
MLRILLFCFLVCSIVSCDNTVSPEQPAPLISHNWRLVEFTAARTSCTLCVDQPCNTSTILFEKLIGFDNDSSIVTSIQLTNEIFWIKENNQSVITGTLELDSANMKLQHGSTHLDLQLIMVSDDSLILFTKGGEYGLADITLVFTAEKNVKK